MKNLNREEQLEKMERLFRKEIREKKYDTIMAYAGWLEDNERPEAEAWSLLAQRIKWPCGNERQVFGGIAHVAHYFWREVREEEKIKPLLFELLRNEFVHLRQKKTSMFTSRRRRTYYYSSLWKALVDFEYAWTVARRKNWFERDI